MPPYSRCPQVSVTVLDRPTPPEGLIATPAGGEDKRDACSLLWKKSKDDGGAPIEYYQVHKCHLFLFMRYSTMWTFLNTQITHNFRISFVFLL